MSSSAGASGASASGGGGGTRTVADRLGIRPGMVVLEMGYEDDADESLREDVVQRCGQEFVDEGSDEVVDAGLLWFRDGDGDLVDLLMDALVPLADDGIVWVLTPKQGRPGHVPPSEVSESAPTAGLSQTSSISAGRDWSGARLVPPRNARRR